MICAVMVVPMLAPMMMGMAWRRFMRPAATKPMVITVVADELCSTAVATAPASTATSGFFVTAARMERMRSPAASCKLPLIRFMPYRNRAKPPNSPSPICNSSSTHVSFSRRPGDARTALVIARCILRNPWVKQVRQP